jgi:hypothetical protein
VEILNSWKEIANYLGRGVRTVQRWESDLGLPVHRPKGKDRSAVLAFPFQLEAWLGNTPVRSRDWGSTSPDSGDGEQRNAAQPSNGKQRIAFPRPANAPPLRLVPGYVRAAIKPSDVHESCVRTRLLCERLLESSQRQSDLTAAIRASVKNLRIVPRPRITA